MEDHKVLVQIEMYREDVDWLMKTYGTSWPQRLEQHIHNEVTLRRQDNDDQLKMRKPWDY